MFLAVTVVASGLRAWAASDPLTTEIERWRAFLRDDRTAGVELLASLKTDIEPAMAGTEKALREGLTLLAFHRLAAVQGQLAAAAYLALRPATQRKDPMEFEREWSRMGSELRTDLATAPSPAALDGVRPVAVRAAGEAAMFKVRVLYESSLEYGRNTMPESGLYYIGAALAQEQFAALCRSMSAPTGLGEIRPRSLQGELDALQGELLLAYRPPASIDRHRQFIAANAAIKEARELDTAGLRYGALYRYLEAVLRVSLARTTPLPQAETLRGLLREAEPRLSATGLDHSIGRVYFQSAQANLDAALGGDPAVTSAIVSFVLPRYFAALEPEPPRPAPPKAAVTVTLVRWPYT